MNDAPAPQQIPLPGFIQRSSHQYHWSMAITLALLLIQAAIFWGVAVSLFSSIDWELVEALDEPPELVLRQIIRAIVLVPFGAALLFQSTLSAGLAGFPSWRSLLSSRPACVGPSRVQ